MKTLQIRNMPEDLHRRLTAEAQDRGISLNRLLLEHLSEIAWANRHLTRRKPER